MKWLFTLLGICTQLSAGTFGQITPSSPEEIASLSTNLVVEDCVSVLSGQFSLSEIDLKIRGAQDLLFKRTYVPPQILGKYDEKDERDRLALGKALLQLNTKGWVALPHLFAGYNKHSPYFQVRDSSGYVLEFQINGTQGMLQTSSYGCTNLKGEEPSSQADIRNILFVIEGNETHITWPTGVKRTYIQQSPWFYRLDRETLPNGKVVRYQYNAHSLSQITTTDISGKHIYSSLEHLGNNHFKGSDGRKVKLDYETQEIKGKYKKKKFKEKAKLHFPIMTKASHPSYCNKARYNKRTLLTEYDAEKYLLSASYIEQKDTLCRIQKLSTPSGSISFSYDTPIPGKKGGSTTVTYPDGVIVIYRFNASLLLTAIENWLDGKLYNQKTFTYDHKQHIAKIETKEGNGNTLFTKVYECDAYGNPTLEMNVGDFGTFSIKRSFSKNRLISEIRDDGLGFAYTYLNDTHLPLSKTTLSHGKPIKKTFYVYDEACNLIQKREENKTITDYVLYNQGPHLHCLQSKIEKDWEGNLIHQTDYFYDQYGNVSQEDHFGADGTFAYNIQRKYDSKGNILEETNPLGQKASYSYDERNRPLQEIPFSNRLQILKQYDAKGRLLTLKEGDRTSYFSYNSSDELVEKTNYLGIKTSYQYHPVHGKPIFIQEEETLTEIAYDAFGREILKKDAYGAMTQTSYNSYGNPVQITYPDGGIETFSYASNGLLVQKIDPDGIREKYSYDSLGRMLSKRVSSYETTYEYDSNHLIKEVDPLGISTHFLYNLAGQKIQEERAGRITYFTYDSLGYLAGTRRAGRNILYQNDLLGRILEKNTDHALKTTYTYDEAGNVASITQGNTIYFTYDPYNRLIKKIDEEGAVTTISYTEEDGYTLKKTTDPRGVEKFETYNAHGLLTKREIPEALLEEFSYDKALRLSSQDHLTFTYTLEGFQSSITEAGSKTTSWNYTPGGKIESKQKPDGTNISYKYDDKGHVTNIGSKEFQYDALGRLIKATGFTREYDAFGNILKEEFETGLTIESQYDDWDRPTSRVLPDGSKILYEYEGPFLKVVKRISQDGSLAFTHTYESFDQKGNVLSESGAFTTSYSYDKVGRKIYQNSPYFEEELVYDEAGNLIKKGNIHLTYDQANRLTSENDLYTLFYDDRHNCTQKNGCTIQNNEHNQREDFFYDHNGNLLKSDFIYDEFDQLIFDGIHKNVYDAIGRRLSSGGTSYFYFNEEEIGSFENGKIQELKISGMHAPIAIEIDSINYAPVVDVQNTIRQLIDSKSGKLFAENNSDAFGCNINPTIPYAYMGKRYDPSTGFVYFGKRFYNPETHTWTTPDPLGPIDHSNLYQYVFNNPYKYYDPNGESIGGYLLGIGQIIAGGAIMASGVVFEIATFGGYTFALGFHEAAGMSLMASGCAMAMYHAQDMKAPSIAWKNTNPFDGPVDGGVIVVDPQGNAIPVGEGNWLTGSKDSNWIQEMTPNERPQGRPTGTRKNGGHPPGPKHPDPRAWEPHGHVPGVTNPDGTPWLPIH